MELIRVACTRILITKVVITSNTINKTSIAVGGVGGEGIITGVVDEAALMRVIRALTI